MNSKKINLESLNVTTSLKLADTQGEWVCCVGVRRDINLFETLKLYASEELSLSHYDIEEFDAIVEFLENYTKEIRLLNNDYFYFWFGNC